MLRPEPCCALTPTMPGNLVSGAEPRRQAQDSDGLFNSAAGSKVKVVGQMKDTENVATPQWITAIMSELDSLEFGPGFERFTETTQLVFGDKQVEGVQAIQDFFRKLDGPLDTVHAVAETWRSERTFIVRGAATMSKKTAPEDTTVAPFVHIFVCNDNDQLETMRVVAGPLNVDSALLA